MPELPDVEFVKRRLERALVGATITRADCRDRRILRPSTPAAFRRATENHVVRDVSRRGKWVRVVLDDETRLFSHLGMTGWWIDVNVGAPEEPSERARLDVVKGGRSRSLRYLDSRRFGRLLVAKRDIADWTGLGPDPLSDGLDAEVLAAALAHSRRPVKDAIMDQSILAGVGNIIATEGLFLARVDPRSPSNALSSTDVEKIIRGLDKAIGKQLAVRLGSKSDDWHERFAVYGRSGEPCSRCMTPIEHVVIGGRTSAFCPKCQALSSTVVPRHPAKHTTKRAKKQTKQKT
jgi:formamidopyrimidine-DNA glycosylase